MNKYYTYKISKESEELKKLILENPDLQLVVLAREESWDGEHTWTFCDNISFRIEEILNCDYVDDHDCVFVDRDDLEEHIENCLYDEYCDKPEEEYEAAIVKKLAELEPYWEKVIAIYATT